VNLTVFAAAICSVSPVLGLRPVRAGTLAGAEGAKTDQLNSVATSDGLRHDIDKRVNGLAGGGFAVPTANAIASTSSCLFIFILSEFACLPADAGSMAGLSRYPRRLSEANCTSREGVQGVPTGGAESQSCLSRFSAWLRIAGRRIRRGRRALGCALAPAGTRVTGRCLRLLYPLYLVNVADRFVLRAPRVLQGERAISLITSSSRRPYVPIPGATA